MHIETLKCYCDLVETGSFSRAAALNLISQSAISQQVRALERRYDQVLIERGTRRRAVPTEAGHILYVESRELLGRFNALEERMRSQSASITGTVRVATVYSIGLHLLPRYMKRFIRLHPQVKIHVEYHRTDKVCEACLNNTIDIGIVALPVRRSNLEVIPFRDEKLVLVCNPEHPLARRDPVEMAALAGFDFVGFERDIPTRKTIDRILRSQDVRAGYVMQFDNIETIKRSVEVGNGISILPESAVINEVRSGQLVTLDFREGTFTRSLGIVRRRGRAQGAAASEFIRLLQDQSLDKQEVISRT